MPKRNAGNCKHLWVQRDLRLHNFLLRPVMMNPTDGPEWRTLHSGRVKRGAILQVIPGQWDSVVRDSGHRSQYDKCKYGTLHCFTMLFTVRLTRCTSGSSCTVSIWMPAISASKCSFS